MNMPPPVVAVVGATATGKSEFALALAERLNGEIVNADALQFYRGMDIGTAKLPPAERRGIPHWLIDVLEVTQEASVAVFQAQARSLIDGLRSLGRVPVLVGGSGLYVRAVLDDLRFPGTDPGVRTRLEERLAEEGVGALRSDLERLDPAAAEKIAPADERRTVRALEVIELTGKPFSAHLPEYRHLRPTVQLGLAMDRHELHSRIERRVAQMWEHGLLDEVEQLLGRGLAAGRTASRAIGYAQAIAQLEGRLSEAEAQSDTVVQTRRFAKRQGTWFRRDQRIHWLDATRPLAELTDEALDLIRTHR
ncbi:tRNA (adenosine(37)-N6)-dimethylallyltransferase MiaA [Sediminivirga luteola]|uniref:tRNA dimethylallyltransferase n=2 Tax=Sediminivirga luteola TaxID=1774748 RepID=A0A8J2TXJ5_9MICO|nr:tRNA dimethylallyltransferase [Sediminivirga luteola]